MLTNNNWPFVKLGSQLYTYIKVVKGLNLHEHYQDMDRISHTQTQICDYEQHQTAST